MKYLSQYKIPFSGLAIGKHEFDFFVDDEFFSFFEYSLVKKGKLNVQVTLSKQENMILLNFDIKGHIELSCDTCLSEIWSPIAIHEDLLIKFDDDPWLDENDDILILTRQDYELDLVNHLYEYINVSIPLYPKCSEHGEGKECDEEMMRVIRKEDTQSNENEKQSIDPRWEILKKIKNN